jgi:large subunit ribosomal protein L21
MYAVIEAGGKQFRVQTGDTVKIDRLGLEPGAEVEFNHVVALSDDNQHLLTGADVANAKVRGAVTGHSRGDKVLVFKFKRKKQYKRTIGHRQDYTEVKINEILA